MSIYLDQALSKTFLDDYGGKSEVAFDIAYGGYKNEQQNIHFFS